MDSDANNNKDDDQNYQNMHADSVTNNQVPFIIGISNNNQPELNDNVHNEQDDDDDEEPVIDFNQIGDELDAYDRALIDFLYEDASVSSGYQEIDIFTGDDVEDGFFDETSDEEEEDDYISRSHPDEYLSHDPTPDTPYPKPEWNTIHELRARKLGLARSRLPFSRRMSLFEQSAGNSLWMIQRLESRISLEEHLGAVNCLHFNQNGRLLASGSDDHCVCIWDWQRQKMAKKLVTKHTDSVSQAQFCDDSKHLVTSSRDGTVRLIDIEKGISDCLLAQYDEISSLSFINSSTLVSAGSSCDVHAIDLRARKATKLFTVRDPIEKSRRCRLYNINIHPLDRHKAFIGGESPYVFHFDLRMPLSYDYEKSYTAFYCPNDLIETYNIVTGIEFNSSGDKLLISYNDEDLVVCDTNSREVLHRYKGHRNRRTIKGCEWFGDNYVLSGSDDGYIFGWDLESEHIVCFLPTKAMRTVNCVKKHPSLPVLASAGLHHAIDIWEPISSEWPRSLRGIKPQVCKNTMRRTKSGGRSPPTSWRVDPL